MDKIDVEKQRIFDEGRSWFQYVQKDFEKAGGTVPAYERGGLDFFLAIGLIGRLADFDTDDVDYTLGRNNE